MDDLILRGATLMTCDPARPGLGIIEDGAVVLRGDQVLAVFDPKIPAEAAALRLAESRARTEHVDGALVTPGLVDCHTHGVWAGDRGFEFGLRARGATYLEIAAAGGGIARTVEATRAATDDALVAGVQTRWNAMLAHGTTTCEAKTGYGLSIDEELRHLRVLDRAARGHAMTMVPTLLAAHVPPPESKSNPAARAAYVVACANEILSGAKGLAHAVDVYCDEGAFTLDEAESIWRAAHGAGFAVRGHVGQFKDLGAARVLASLSALSADHLEAIDVAQARLLAAAGTVAVLLPGACVQLRCPVPPVGVLRDAGCALAIATDYNPGSSCSESLPLQMWLAMTHYGMTLEETWLGVTRIAARAAGRPQAGQLRAGAPADLVVWNATDAATVPYRYGANLVRTVFAGGVAATL